MSLGVIWVRGGGLPDILIVRGASNRLVRLGLALYSGFCQISSFSVLININ